VGLEHVVHHAVLPDGGHALELGGHDLDLVEVAAAAGDVLDADAAEIKGERGEGRGGEREEGKR
jgi:hypothetical protein